MGWVGNSNDELDLVDLNLVIGPVVESFGRFVKHSVQEKEQSPGTGSKMPRATNTKVPFYASVQDVKNAQLIVQCEECNMWRLVYSKYKLSVAKCHQLQQF